MARRIQAARGGEQLLKCQFKVVVLDKDVAQVFTTPESVNKVLRALLESMLQAGTSVQPNLEAGVSPAPPTPPDMRPRIRRFTNVEQDQSDE